MTENEGRFNPEDEREEGEDITDAYNNMDPEEFSEYIGNMPRETKVVLNIDITEAAPKLIERISTRFSTADITITSHSEITQLERNMFPPNVKLVQKS